MENLDHRIRKSLEIVDFIKDNYISEDQGHPFGKGTHPGNLLIGLLLEIYQSTYHCGTPLETLLNRAEHIPPIMENTSTTNKIAWSHGSTLL